MAALYAVIQSSGSNILVLRHMFDLSLLVWQDLEPLSIFLQFNSEAVHTSGSSKSQGVLRLVIRTRRRNLYTEFVTKCHRLWP